MIDVMTTDRFAVIGTEVQKCRRDQDGEGTIGQQHDTKIQHRHRATRRQQRQQGRTSGDADAHRQLLANAGDAGCPAHQVRCYVGIAKRVDRGELG